MTLIRVAVYCRFSSEGQNEASIRQQFAIVRAWCKQHGYKIVAVYRDRGRSGSTMHRPGVQRMLADAKTGAFDIVVTHKLNRLSRNLVDVILTVDQLQKLTPKVLYASATEIFDCTSMIGKVLLILLAFFAEWYLHELSAETTRGKHDRVATKRLQNNRPPWGYRYVDKNTPPVPDDTQNAQATTDAGRTPALAMQYVYELRITPRQGGGVINIDQLTAESARQLNSDAQCAAWLNGQGFKTPLGRPFTADTVGDLLSNPFFAGFVRETGYTEGTTKGGNKKRSSRRGARLYPGVHTALVSREQFDLVQRAREMTAFNRTGRAARADRVYLMGDGLAVCSSCGQPLNCHAVYDRSGAKAYHCNARRRNQPCSAPSSFVREGLLVPYLNTVMQALVLPEIMERRVAELAAGTGPVIEDYGSQIAELRARADGLDARLELGRITADSYRSEMKAVLDKIADLERRQAGSGIVQVEVAFEEYRGLVTVWSVANDEERREILHALFDGIRVDIAGKRIEAVKPKADFAFLFASSSAMESIGRGWYAIKRSQLDNPTETVRAEVTGFVTGFTVSRIPWASGAPPTYAELGSALGLTRQRAQQLYRDGTVTWRIEAGVLVVTRQRRK